MGLLPRRPGRQEILLGEYRCGAALVLTSYSDRGPDSSYIPEMQGEPQGQAALLFCESLIHIMVEEKILTLEQALSVLATAVEVKVDMGGLESEELKQASMRYLREIARSLATKNGGSMLTVVE